MRSKRLIWHRRNINSGTVERIPVTVLRAIGPGQVKVVAHFRFGDAIRYISPQNLRKE